MNQVSLARLTVIAALVFMALRPAQAADIPQQYRGHWCDTVGRQHLSDRMS